MFKNRCPSIPTPMSLARGGCDFIFFRNPCTNNRYTQTVFNFLRVFIEAAFGVAAQSLAVNSTVADITALVTGSDYEDSKFSPEIIYGLLAAFGLVNALWMVVQFSMFQSERYDGKEKEFNGVKITLPRKKLFDFLNDDEVTEMTFNIKGHTYHVRKKGRDDFVIKEIKALPAVRDIEEDNVSDSDTETDYDTTSSDGDLQSVGSISSEDEGNEDMHVTGDRYDENSPLWPKKPKRTCKESIIDKLIGGLSLDYAFVEGMDIISGPATFIVALAACNLVATDEPTVIWSRLLLTMLFSLFAIISSPPLYRIGEEHLGEMLHRKK